MFLGVTVKLYYQDPYLREFTAEIVERLRRDGRPGVVLDRTAFYATGGGQPHDTGTLSGVRVVDVVEEGDRIIHFVEADVPGREVKGVVDWERRVDHMQQHHGQHILSEAFIRVANAPTVAFHLGPLTSTIDVDRRDLSEEEVSEAQDLANRVVFENRPVSVTWHTLQEARRLPLRKLPEEIEEPVRVVTISDFDMQPCSGTHPRSSGEVGVIAVLGCERMKAQTRVTFVCGHRAARTLRRYSKMLRSISAKLSAPVEEVEAAIDRRLAEAAALRRTAAEAEKVMARLEAREMIASVKGKVCMKVVEGRDIKYLKMVASEVTAQAPVVAVLVSPGAEGTRFVIGASRELDVDFRQALKEILEKVPGKGGGEARFVQGSFQSGNAAEVLRAIEERIRL